MWTCRSHRAGILPAGPRRAAPFIYSQADLDALLDACTGVFTRPLLTATMRTTIGLLAATGMRIGEALRLTADDIDTEAGALLVRASKRKDRLVPVHPSTVEALFAYRDLPARAAAHPATDGPLLVSTRGTGYQRSTIEAHFARVARRRRAATTRSRPSPPARPAAHLRHRAHGSCLPGRHRPRAHADAVGDLARPHQRRPHLLVPDRHPGIDGPGREPNRNNERIEHTMTLLAAPLQRYFTDYAHTQRDLSPNTIASYRDTWRQLIKPHHRHRVSRGQDRPGRHRHRPRHQLSGAPHDRPPQQHRHLQRAAHRDPRRVGPSPARSSRTCRHDRTRPGDTVPTPPRTHREFLTTGETEVLLAAPDTSTWTGRRDQALLALAVQTGLGVSELITLTCQRYSHRHRGTRELHGEGTQVAPPPDRHHPPFCTPYLAERATRPGAPASRAARKPLLPRRDRTGDWPKTLATAAGPVHR